MDRVNEQVINYDLIEDVLNLILARTDSNDMLVAPEGGDLSRGSVLIFLPGLGEIRSLSERLEASRTLGNGRLFNVIPMHSTLSSVDQRKVFVPAKPGCRKIILSTNIAETSITIPDVVCGKKRNMLRECTHHAECQFCGLNPYVLSTQ
jgi:ATP-dependent RNA helicase DHX29